MNNNELRQIAINAIFRRAPGMSMPHTLHFSNVFTPEKIIALLDQIVGLENELSLANDALDSRDKNIDDLVAHNANLAKKLEELTALVNAHLGALEGEVMGPSTAGTLKTAQALSAAIGVAE